MNKRLNNGMKAFFILIILTMLTVTIWACGESNVVQGFQTVLQSKWGTATLFDTYFSFTLIYIWMAQRIQGLIPKIVWFLLVMVFGTMAIAAFGLLEIKKQNRGQKSIL